MRYTPRVPLASITYDVGVDDHVEVMRRSLPRSAMVERAVRTQQKNALIAVVGAAVAMGIYGYARAPQGSGAVGALQMLLVLVPIAAMYFLFVGRRAAIFRRFEHRLEQGIQAGQIPEIVNGTWTLDLERDEAVTRTERATKRYRWSECRGVHEEADAVWLEFEEGGLVRVPDRAFADTEERRAFVEVARERALNAGEAPEAGPGPLPNAGLGEGGGSEGGGGERGS